MTEADQEHGRGRKFVRNRHRDREYALEEVNNLTENEFSKIFRLSRVGFSELLSLIEPFMHDADEVMAKRSSGTAISKRTKLYATLRYLAGGSYLDICFAWGLAKSTFYSTCPEKGVLWPTLEALDQALPTIGLPVHDLVKLRTMADEFASFSNGELKGCVTAIDGWVARTRKPKHSEVTDIMSYRNRHDCWGFVVLARCDARCRFTMFSCMNSGSTNDEPSLREPSDCELRESIISLT